MKFGFKLTIASIVVALVVAAAGWISIGRVRPGASSLQSEVGWKSGVCWGYCPRTASASEGDPSQHATSGRITLDPKLFVGPVRQAYTVAEKNPLLLSQLDCYCGCYETDGHRSLLDCYRSRHGATCQICTDEALEADRLFNSGMAPAQIKEALRRKFQTAAQ
jgi:hypothetical protein